MIHVLSCAPCSGANKSRNRLYAPAPRLGNPNARERPGGGGNSNLCESGGASRTWFQGEQIITQPLIIALLAAYFCFGELVDGLTVVSFMINSPQAENPTLFASQSFTNLLDLMAGDPFTGMSLASTTCRPGPVEVVGYLNLFPIGVGDACVHILDDPDFPRWVVDCTLPNGLVDYYCVLSNGTIGADDCPEGDCGASPVEDATWGGIKALYR